MYYIHTIVTGQYGLFCVGRRNILSVVAAPPLHAMAAVCMAVALAPRAAVRMAPRVRTFLIWTQS